MPENSPEIPNSKYVILFVDDSPVDRAYIEGVLVNNGFQLFLAENHEQALRLAREKKPDLILLDILLPKVSGIEVCKEMKADDTIKHIPVIFYTSIDTPKNMINYAGYGAVDYLHKSIPPVILVEQLRAAIQASKKF
jgi:DNA-binding response OmpR family regulator